MTLSEAAGNVILRLIRRRGRGIGLASARPIDNPGERLGTIGNIEETEAGTIPANDRSYPPVKLAAQVSTLFVAGFIVAFKCHWGGL